MALAVSVGVASIVVRNDKYLSSLFMCAVAIVGVGLFDFLRDLRRAIWFREHLALLYGGPIKSFGAYLGEHLWWNLLRLLVAIVVAAMVLRFEGVQQLPVPGIAVL